jgi:hypothetical protein
MANYPPQKKVSLEGKLTLSEALCYPELKCVGREKLKNALSFYGDKSPKPVCKLGGAYYYDKNELLTWARVEKVKHNKYPPKFLTREKRIEIQTSYFNKMAKAFITSKRI